MAGDEGVRVPAAPLARGGGARAASSDPSRRPVKRRRLRACDSCRQRKIRCDDSEGQCRNCATYRTDCIISRSDDGPDITRGLHVPREEDDDGDGSRRATRIPARRKHSSISRSSNTGHGNDDWDGIVNDAAAAHDHVYVAHSHEETDHDNNDDGNSHLTQIIATGSFQGSRPSPQNSNASAASPTSSRASRPEVLEGVVVIESANVPKKSKFAGMSSGQVLAKSAEELFKDQANGVNVMAFFTPMMTFSEEVPRPSMYFHPLIDKEQADLRLNAYFSTVHLIFPVIEEHSIRQFYEGFYRDGHTKDASRACCIYLLIALGDSAPVSDEIHSAHFMAAWNLYDRLISDPYLSSVQALLLLTLELMNSHKDGQALLAIGSAIRMAQSIGLHRKLAAHKHPHEMKFVRQDYGLRSCVWWACYCLDKKLCFEGGRPSIIRDEDCDADLPTSKVTLVSPSPIKLENGLSIFSHLISLCQILSLISSRLFSRAITERSEEALLQQVVLVDRELLNWKRDLPDEIKPDSELATMEVQPLLYGLGLLHCIYHNAMLIMHRAALLGNVASTEMKMQGNSRMAASESVCLRAAGALARCVNDLVNTSSNHCIIRWTTPYILNAVFTLYIGVMKSPFRWSCETDLALMKSTAACLAQTQLNQKAIDHFAALVRSLCKAVEIAQGQQPSRLQTRPPPFPKTVIGYEGQQQQNQNTVPGGDGSGGQLVGAAQQNGNSNGTGGSMAGFNNNYGMGSDLGIVGGEQPGEENNADFQFQDFFGDDIGLLNMQLWPTNMLFESPGGISYDMNG